MELNISSLLLILFLLMVMQGIGTYVQVKKYKAAVHRVHKLGNIGLGQNRRRFGPGSIVIIACDSAGKITGGEEMSGMTIFTGFKEIEGIVGKTIYELKDEYLKMPKSRQKFYKGHIQAVEALEARLKMQSEQKEEARKNNGAETVTDL